MTHCTTGLQSPEYAHADKGGGYSYKSADIICLYFDPPFFTNLKPNDPIFHYSLHPMTPFFQNFNINCQFFCALPAHIKDFVKIQIFTWIWQNLHQMTPYFERLTPKKAQFIWIPHPMSPISLQIPTPNAACFRWPVGTYPSLSYSSAPPLDNLSFFSCGRPIAHLLYSSFFMSQQNNNYFFDMPKFCKHPKHMACWVESWPLKWFW